jgi:uncharacterized RDD family membrane protein YckC
MAIRQLNYCTHCGMPVFKQGGGPVYFCQNCGHGLAGLGPAIGSRSSSAPGSAGPARPSLVRRVAAAGLDLFLGSLAAVVASSIAVQAAIIVQGRHTADPRAVAWIAGIAVLAAYQPFFWARFGATPGMQLFGICLTRPDGSRLGPARALGREMAMVASALPLGLGFAWAARDARGQAWHDRIAGTVVVAAAAPVRTRRFPPTTAS